MMFYEHWLVKSAWLHYLPSCKQTMQTDCLHRLLTELRSDSQCNNPPFQLHTSRSTLAWPSSHGPHSNVPYSTSVLKARVHDAGAAAQLGGRNRILVQSQDQTNYPLPAYGKPRKAPPTYRIAKAAAHDQNELLILFCT